MMAAGGRNAPDPKPWSPRHWVLRSRESMTFRHKHSCNTLLEKEAGTGHPKYFLHIGKIPLTMLKKKKKKDL